MEANGGGQVIVETLWTETQHSNQFGQCVAWPIRKVRIAWICAAHVGAKGAAAAGRVLIECEPVLLLLARRRADTGNRLFLNRLQRITRSRPADHRRG